MRRSTRRDPPNGRRVARAAFSGSIARAHLREQKAHFSLASPDLLKSDEPQK